MNTINALDTINKQLFTEIIQEHFEEIQLMKLKYLALEIAEAETDQLFNDSRTQVLRDNEFFATIEKANSFAKRCNGKIINRILDESDAWLMPDKDFDKYNKLCTMEHFKRGLVDENGYILPKYRTTQKRFEYKQKMLKFFISLLPKSMQTIFNANFYRVVVQDKLLELFNCLGGNGA